AVGAGAVLVGMGVVVPVGAGGVMVAVGAGLVAVGVVVGLPVGVPAGVPAAAPAPPAPRAALGGAPPVPAPPRCESGVALHPSNVHTPAQHRANPVVARILEATCMDSFCGVRPELRKSRHDARSLTLTACDAGLTVWRHVASVERVVTG